MCNKNGILLNGIDGSNPLGFLAALGTLRTLSLALPTETVRIAWEQDNGAWRPRVHSTANFAEDKMIEILCGQITKKTANLPVNQDETNFKAEVSAKKKKLKGAKNSLKARQLKGKEREAAYAKEVAPIEIEYEASNVRWLSSLATVVLSTELSLGRDLSGTPEHFKTVAKRAADEVFEGTRHAADMVSVFGSEACVDYKSNRIEATPFCFITGSGHQYFLDTASSLMACVDFARLRSALLESLPYADQKFSMRWAPIEDRRYALMWADPTSPGNEPVTSWALNLMAYRGLSLISASPTVHGFRTAGFARQASAYTWSWPIWQFDATDDIARSLLSDAKLFRSAEYRRERGVAACFTAERIVVGNPPLHKINFSPAMPI